MSKFNDLFPQRYLQLCDKFDDIDRQIDVLWLGGHDCNCEFCDYIDTRDIDEIEEKEKELIAERRVIEDTLRRMEIYAKDHKIKFTQKERSKR